MNCLLKDCQVYIQGTLLERDILISGSRILKIAAQIVPNDDVSVFHFKNKVVLPGFIDVHVHLREPGFSYKETIYTGTKAAAHGGYTAVCTMPNLSPPPDCKENLAKQMEIIKKDAVVAVYPYGPITKGELGIELSDMEALADNVIAFSDDGRGVQSEEVMRHAMQKAKSLHKIIAAHCEDNSLLKGGYIHQGAYAAAHGHRGICSESEWGPIARDIAFAEETGCQYHVCHVSAKESVEVFRQAKARGVDITCETAPHYLLLNDEMLQEEGRFKMNPPVRSEEDRLALLEGLQDGTIDMIATDHAPHSAEEKRKGLEKSLMGVVGLETAFPLLYTYLVKRGKLTLEKLVELMSTRPGARFGISTGLREGAEANLTVFDLNAEYQINSDDFLSMGKATPFEGWKVNGLCEGTMYKGEWVWNKQ